MAWKLKIERKKWADEKVRLMAKGLILDAFAKESILKIQTLQKASMEIILRENIGLFC